LSPRHQKIIFLNLKQNVSPRRWFH
jgi:hypothetical protein